MLALQILSILLGILSGFVGFSATFYLLFRAFTDRSFRRASEAYGALLSTKIATDPKAVKDLLKFVRTSISKYDSPETAQHGMMRRWEETVRLVFKPGEVERRENFVGIHPIYGFNEKGEETLIADKNTFHQMYVSQVNAGQQRMAFFILLIAFLVQFAALFIPL